LTKKSKRAKLKSQLQKTMAKYNVNKDKCLGCFICTVNCPQGMGEDTDGKAKVVNDEEVERAGGTAVCPHGVVEKQEGE
jgi:ferredoxin